jgi:hypothetical protein
MVEIKGFKDYFIDKHGNVTSYKFPNGHGGTKKYRKLKLHTGKLGYVTFAAKVKEKDGTMKIKRSSVHRAVAVAFIPNPDSKRCVNHIDGDKSNNNVNNLEWCTHSENMKHAFENKLNHGPPLNIMKGNSHPRSKLKNSDVLEIRKDYKENRTPQRQLAKKYNVKQSTIWNIIHRKLWSHI